MPTNDIGQDRFQARLTKELRIKGSMPAPVLAPEIVPVLVVEGERTENLHIQREHRFGCTLSLAGIAAEYWYFQLNNPAGSNGLVVVEEFGVTTATAWALFDWGYAWPALSASLAARASYCYDSRVPGRAPNSGLGVPLVGTDIAAGNLDVMGRIETHQTGMERVEVNMVLTPGYGFSIWDGVVQQAVAGYCIWRERQLMDGEFIGP